MSLRGEKLRRMRGKCAVGCYTGYILTLLWGAGQVGFRLNPVCGGAKGKLKWVGGYEEALSWAR